MATLTGHVSHYTEEMAAERAARRVKGVHAIAEGIEVRCLGETSDEEIARRAPNILKWHAMVPQDAVQAGDVIWQSAPTFLQRPDVIDREVNSMSELNQIFASFRSSCPRDVRSLSTLQLSPCHRKHNLPDQLRVHPSSDRNGIA